MVSQTSFLLLDFVLLKWVAGDIRHIVAAKTKKGRVQNLSW